jgi:multiple sugar transport system permease protein
VWQGSWRTLEPVWRFAPHWENFGAVWDLIDFPRLLFNTVFIAVVSTIGTLVSCTLVAYGFARFRFPGRSFLFLLLIATIFLPAAVTIIPTYTIFQKMGWVGTWLPLLVPAFFANAYDVFLMRQYFMTIPTEMDEAAAIDGAGPFRTLTAVVLPQAWPVVVAVGVFHLVYSWNDFFGPLLYTAGKTDLQTVALGLQRFNGIYYREPGLIQAGTLMTLVIPVVAFLLTQRFFTRGIVITGVDK